MRKSFLLMCTFIIPFLFLGGKTTSTPKRSCTDIELEIQKLNKATVYKIPSIDSLYFSNLIKAKLILDNIEKTKNDKTVYFKE